MGEDLYTRCMVTTSKDRKRHKEFPCLPNTPALSFLDTSCPLSKGYQDLHSLLCQESLASCGAPCVCFTWVEPCDVTLLEVISSFCLGLICAIIYCPMVGLHKSLFIHSVVETLLKSLQVCRCYYKDSSMLACLLI